MRMLSLRGLPILKAMSMHWLTIKGYKTGLFHPMRRKFSGSNMLQTSCLVGQTFIRYEEQLKICSINEANFNLYIKDRWFENFFHFLSVTRFTHPWNFLYYLNCCLIFIMRLLAKWIIKNVYLRVLRYILLFYLSEQSAVTALIPIVYVRKSAKRKREKIGGF